MDVEVRVEEDFTTLLHGVDWEKVEFKQVNNLGASQRCLNTPCDAKRNCHEGGAKARSRTMDYGNGKQIVEVNVESELSLDYDSVKDEPFKKYWVDSSNDKDDALFDQYTKAILEVKKATKNKGRKKQANNIKVDYEDSDMMLPQATKVDAIDVDKARELAYKSKNVYSLDESFEDKNGDIIPKK